MISDKAVEAAARAMWRYERQNDQHDESFKLTWYAGEARAALQAALPVLLEGREEEIVAHIDRVIVFFDAQGGDKFTSHDAASRIISILTGESDA